MQKGQTAKARRVLQEALQAAQNIPTEQSRNNSINRIKQALKQPASTGHR